MRKYFLFMSAPIFIVFLLLFNLNSFAEESLFNPELVSSPLVKKVFSFIEIINKPIRLRQPSIKIIKKPNNRFIFTKTPFLYFLNVYSL